MKMNALMLAVAACAVLGYWDGALAQQDQTNRDQAQQQVRSQDREQVYGSELMTEQERQQYREKMRSMTTEEERAAYRAQHHEEMQRRASKMGVDLPEQPPGQGKGKGQGKGYGQGSGNPGKGSGSGKGGGK